MASHSDTDASCTGWVHHENTAETMTKDSKTTLCAHLLAPRDSFYTLI